MKAAFSPFGGCKGIDLTSIIIKMKAMTRQQIACQAGVTVKTLSKWMKPFKQELEAIGLRPGMIVLPPNIVKWIAEKFCIDL